MLPLAEAVSYRRSPCSPCPSCSHLPYRSHGAVVLAPEGSKGSLIDMVKTATSQIVSSSPAPTIDAALLSIAVTKAVVSHTSKHHLFSRGGSSAESAALGAAAAAAGSASAPAGAATSAALDAPAAGLAAAADSQTVPRLQVDHSTKTLVFGSER